MTADELEKIVERAYGEPGNIVSVALCAFVHEHYDLEATDAEQVAELFTALWRVKERLERIIAAVDQAGRKAYRT